MRMILMTGALALLAGCDPAGTPPATEAADGPPTTSAAAPPAGPPVAPEQRTFRSWLASCDNGGDCVAFAGPADGTGAGWLRVALAAGPEARPTLMAGFWPGDDGAGVLSLVIDGRSWPLGAAPDQDAHVGQVAEAVAAEVIAALPTSRSLRLTRGGEQVALSPAGAAAALLWIDEKQGRLDTPTALARRGDRPAAAVPAPPALPLVTPAPAADGPALAAVLPASLAQRPDVRECGENLRWNPTLSREVTRDRLDAATELWGVPCDAGAYNLMSRHFLTGPDGRDPRPLDVRGEGWGDGGGEPLPMLVNAAYDPATRTLSQFAKARGLGDCGAHQSWLWTGRAFVLSREAVMGECWGVPADLWPTRWRTRQP